jgi:hypothetical protein
MFVPDILPLAIPLGFKAEGVSINFNLRFDEELIASVNVCSVV